VSVAIIDINSDLGESREALADGTDFEIMRHITSANIACGGHAGDLETMRQVLNWARELNVAAGAHPSYPDRKNFGRVEIAMLVTELEDSLRAQITSLMNVAAELGMAISHVKPHGALYHACSKHPGVAQAVGRAALAVNPGLLIYGLAGSPATVIWRTMGLRIIAEAFADRAYEPNGTLRDRKVAGAVLDPESAAEQALSIALKRTVNAGGKQLRVEAQTLCIHSDTTGAPQIARKVARALEAAGVQLAAPSV